MWFLRKMAWPISLIYGSIVYVRNLLYDHKILGSKSFKTPTICVGNLSVGGTGKTPMIELLIELFKDQYRLAVLSRGYKRGSRGFQMASETSTVEQLGDEPYQIFQKYPTVSLAVDSNRQNGITQLEKHVNPDIILLDDAFQHRKVKPLFSILLTTYGTPFFNDSYLPTGNLRDSKSSASRADCFIVTKCPPRMQENEQEAFSNRLSNFSKKMILYATLVYDSKLYGPKEKMELDYLKGRKFTLVTGIADPLPLVKHLKKNDLVFEHLKFSDHHIFHSSEIEELRQKSLLVTAEKDYVRLQGKMNNLYSIRVGNKLLRNGKSELSEAIQSKIKRYR